MVIVNAQLMLLHSDYLKIPSMEGTTKTIMREVILQLAG